MIFLQTAQHASPRKQKYWDRKKSGLDFITDPSGHANQPVENARFLIGEPHQNSLEFLPRLFFLFGIPLVLGSPLVLSDKAARGCLEFKMVRIEGILVTSSIVL